MPHQSKSTRSPFDIRLSEEKRRELTARLCDEIRVGKRARSAHMDDNGWIDFAYALYEQLPQSAAARKDPHAGAPDLTSPIGTENVDALAARAVKTIFTEPLWITEGIGASAKQAPATEVFMQWRQERMRLQKVAKRAITSALVETGAVLEVCEDTERIVRHETVKAQILRAPDGSLVLDGKTGQPLPMLDEQGAPVAVEGETEEFVEVHRACPDYRRRGAYVRRRSMKDFLFLPSHAEDEREVWGHATRFYLTAAECIRREADGEYQVLWNSAGAKTVAEALGGDTQEREQRPEQDRAGVSVDYNPGFDTAEKELWRVQFWEDLTGDGLCFITAIVSEIHGVILSLKYDWLGKYRTIYLNPYPCPYAVYGYSMVLTKLLTTIEEHTTWRNLNAWRATLKSNAPLKRLHGAQWDPSIQPFGAAEVIDVGDMNEIQPFDFDDVTPAAMSKEQQCVADAQRVIGMNDIAIGQLSETKRTLGENELATRQSFVRTDDPIGNLQEAFEEVGDIIHAIEVQTLKEMEGGMDAPESITQALTLKGDTSFQGTFTADMVDGQFLFKPRGSTQDADPNRRLQQFVSGINLLFSWAKAVPELGRRVQDPEFAQALLQIWVDEVKPRDRQAFLKPLPPPPPPPGMGMPGNPAAGGMPPGAAPGAPGGLPRPNFGGEELIAQMLAGAGGRVR